MDRAAPGTLGFPARLRKEREKAGLSQTQLAEKLNEMGIAGNGSTIAKTESGDRGVKIDELSALADIFNVSVDTLLGRRTPLQDDLLHGIRNVIDTAKQGRAQINLVRGMFVDRLRDIDGVTFNGRQDMDANAVAAVEGLTAAYEALGRIADTHLPRARGIRMNSDAMWATTISQMFSEAFARPERNVRGRK